MSSIIHINDNNILVHQGDRTTRSQGYAWLSGGDVHFDLDSQNNAVKRCRLEPQQINSSYWQQCAQTSIAQNTSGMRHAADLIWRHLNELRAQEDLIEVKLVVPSHYQAENLQLLLGICKASNIEIQGVVNKAVLALQKHVAQEGRYLHIDVQLHQTVCSEVIAKLDATGSSIIGLGEIEILHEVGLQAMQDALLRAIQERFILGDRFDPLHYAETEQQLFDQLPNLAATLYDQGKANVTVQYQGRQHATSIDLKQWNAALESFTDTLSSVSASGQLIRRYFDFNGFQAVTIDDEDIASINHTEAVLREQAHTLNAFVGTQLKDHEDKVIYITELAVDLADVTNHSINEVKRVEQPELVSKPSTTVAHVTSKSTGYDELPTHLLQAGRAVAIECAGIEFKNGRLDLQVSSSSNLKELLKAGKVFIMGDPERDHLQSGDRIGSEIGDGVVTVIQVLETSVGELS